MKTKKTPTFPQLAVFGQTLVGMGYSQEIGRVKDRPPASFDFYLKELSAEIDANALESACFAAGIDLVTDEEQS